MKNVLLEKFKIIDITYFGSVTSGATVKFEK